MEMSGEYRIPAPRDTVWQALNDPDVLRASIPGCEELNLVSENELTAKVLTKIGPVKQKFDGDVFLENVDAPNSYTLRGEGKGTAGFAKGAADVQLEADGGATVLRYQARADVGGKLAQLGSRLIQGSAKKMADDFFANFVEHVSGPPKEEPAAAPAEEAAPPPRERPVPKRAAAAVEAARRATEERLKGGPPERPFWRRPVVIAVAVVVLLVVLVMVS